MHREIWILTEWIWVSKRKRRLEIKVQIRWGLYNIISIDTEFLIALSFTGIVMTIAIITIVNIFANGKDKEQNHQNIQ